eukprot:TRINITY_DN22089_c0_g1_i1.p1 TRINITY_DN22089_c0_g1~~TRINITY_DN22089_c0_g1_i1.p1  ORF type:complete len:229 (-),score=80.58 TRINITY_DN22089_c0_g1_i1:16-660(-)
MCIRDRYQRRVHGEWTTSFHLGSISFASFILTVIQIMKALAESAKNQAKREGNIGMLILAACLTCLLKCIESLFKFLGKHAMIQIALTGKNFCDAAVDGFWLIFRFAFLFNMVENLKGIFLFLAQLFIAIIPIVLGFAWSIFAVNPEHEIPTFTIIAIFIISISIGGSFMAVWSAGADAILNCFCVDEEVNNGAKFCPKILFDEAEKVRAKEGI